LQIDTYLLLIITSTADELSRGNNIDDFEGPWTPKQWVLWFFAILGCDAHLRVNFRWNILDRQRNVRAKLNWCYRASH